MLTSSERLDAYYYPVHDVLKYCDTRYLQQNIIHRYFVFFLNITVFLPALGDIRGGLLVRSTCRDNKIRSLDRSP